MHTIFIKEFRSFTNLQFLFSHIETDCQEIVFSIQQNITHIVTFVLTYECLVCFSFDFRRAHLRDCLELLKDLVPSPPEHQKATTLALLQSAQQYIKVNLTTSLNITTTIIFSDTLFSFSSFEIVNTFLQ